MLITPAKALKEVEKKLWSYKKRAKKGTPDVYKTELEVWWISVPLQKKLFKQEYSWSGENHTIQKKIWKYIWDKSHVLEVKSQALMYYLAKRDNEDFHRYWPELKSFIGGIENWAHSDTMSDFYSRILEKDAKLVMPTLLKWNKSTNLWKRRQSIVSLFYYYNSRKIKMPSKQKVFQLLKPLILDPEYYVQKGVGWTLRESLQAYPKETKKFIEKHLVDFSSIAFTTMMEKVPKKQKEAYKKKRAYDRMYNKLGKTKTVRLAD